MLPADLPGPVIAESEAPFWAACREHRLVFRRCDDCAAWHHPPLPRCPRCRSARLQWAEARGPARLYAWTRVHVALHPSVEGMPPYLVAVVEFPACGGVRLITNLRAEAPRIGAELDLVWGTVGGAQPVPRFVQRETEDGR